MRGEHRLDLARLDAEAADLDLLVDAGEELQLAVAAPAQEVSGAVEARAGVGRPGEGIRDVALGRQVRTPEIAAREAGAGDATLAHGPHRHRPEPAVEEVDAGAGERPAERRHPPAPPRDRGEGRVGGVLCGAVEVVDPLDARPGVERLDERAGEDLARQVDGGERVRQRPAQQLGHGRRHGVDQGHLAGRRQARQGEDVRRQDHGAAAGERREELEDRQVEGDRGAGEDPPEGRAPLAGGPGEQGDDAAVLDRHALGPARGARGVEDVGELPGVA
jgi:hypothetical protein